MGAAPSEAVAERGAAGPRIQPTVGSETLATANTGVIQSALDAAGPLTIRCAGVAYIAKALILHSNTNLTIDDGCTLRKSAASNDQNMIVNDAYTRAPVSAGVQVDWRGGLLATIRQPRHHRSAGDAIWLSGRPGVTDPAYFGVFDVVSILDADHYVVRLRQRPRSAFAGRASIAGVDSNIHVQGGGQDSNRTRDAAPPDDPSRFNIVFAGVRNLSLENVHPSNSSKYAICLSGVEGFTVRHIQLGEQASDGLHVYGPAFDGVITDVSGRTGDDLLSLQTKETPAYARYQPGAGGDIANVTISKLRGHAKTSLLTIYPHPAFAMNQIVVDDVDGTSDDAATIRISGAENYVGRVGDVHLNGAVARNAAQPLLAISYASLDRVEISGLQVGPEVSGSGDVVAIGGGAFVDTIWLDGVTGATPKTGYLVGINGGGAVQALAIRGARLRARGLRLVHLGVGALVAGDVEQSDLVDLDGVFFVDRTAASQPRLSVANTTLANVGSIFNLSAKAVASMAGVRAKNIYYAALQADGADARLESANTNRLTGSNWVRRVKNTEAISVFGDDILADVTVVARTPGSHFYNTNGSAGNLRTPGPVVDHGVGAGSWRLRDGPPSAAY